jgi:hypothetical protein
MRGPQIPLPERAIVFQIAAVRASSAWPKFDEPRRLNENREVGHCGPVAQLGARFHGMEEVIGSIPIRSTKINNLR